MLPELRQRDVLRFNLVVAYAMLHRCDEARSVFDGLVSRHPTWDEVLSAAGRTALARRVCECVPPARPPPPALPIEGPVALALGASIGTFALGLGISADAIDGWAGADGALAWSVGLGAVASLLLAVGVGVVLTFQLE